MRRAQAIFLIVGLLVAPLSVLAGGFAGGAGECGRMCCPVHRGHAPDENMSCNHGAAGHAASCLLHSGHRQPDYGLAAPLAPAIPSGVIHVASPDISREGLPAIRENSASVFLSPPFQPPRR